MKRAAAADDEGIRGVSRLNLERQVALELSVESRSFMLREVTYLPSRPANGDVFTLTRSCARWAPPPSIVGSGLRRRPTMMVSPIMTSGRPAMAQMSPAPTESTAERRSCCR